MKRLNCVKVWLVLFVFTAIIMQSGGQANADFTFGEPTNLGPNINTSSNDGLPFIAPDGLSLYFISDRPGGSGNHDLYVATRSSTEDDWSQPTNLGDIVNRPEEEYFSCISSNGLELYFDSNRWGSRGARDLWVAKRSNIDASWPSPINMGPNINTASDDVSPNLSADGLTLLFASNRPGGRGDYDIYICTRSSLDASWSAPVNLGEPINSAYLDVGPSLSSDGQVLFFHSIRPTGFGSYDLYYSRKQAHDGLWSSPVLLPSNVNSSYVELGPSLSSDGRTLYFSEHPTYPARPEGFGRSDIWQVSIEPIIDFSGDGIINFDDLMIMIDNWDTDDSLCDIGPMPMGDGIVDRADLEVLMSYWGQEILLPPELIKWKCIVDDFEDYTDTEPDTIYLTWVDGYGDPANGATVGHSFPLAPGEHYVETTIVHNGSQSMPFFYDNTEAFISEATREWEAPQDWTKEGFSELGLWFRGRPAAGSFTEGMYGRYTMTGSGGDIWSTSDEFHFAYKQLSGAGSIIAKVESVDRTHDWAKVGVMIRETLNANSKHATMVVTAARGVSFLRRTSTGGASYSTTRAGISPPRWVKIERTAGGSFIASYSGNGSSWTRNGTVNISMSDTVYIGLAVTSHNSGVMCEAVFSNVSIEGDVSQETWTNQDIGITSNVAEPMYVALNGNAAIYNDDPNAAVIDDWTLWRIDLQEFADQDVNLTSVNSMTIGFGDKENTTAGGDGLVFFDYIGLR